jgi:hypothetical protein
LALDLHAETNRVLFRCTLLFVYVAILDEDSPRALGIPYSCHVQGSPGAFVQVVLIISPREKQ